MTVDEAAAFVRVHPATVRRWIHAGQLPAARIGAGFRIAADDLRQLSKPQHQPAKMKRPDMGALMDRARKMLEADPKKTSSERITELIEEATKGREDELLKHCR